MRASVIIPSYNAASTLPETIESILPQLTEQDEIIIVDDGSTDGTENCIRSYISNRVRYIRQDNSGGPASPRNTGIKAAKGKYIFLFDSDDLMLPAKIETSISILERNSDAGLLFTNFNTIDEQGHLLRHRFLDDYDFIKRLKSMEEGPVYRIEPPHACLQLAKENYIGTSGTVFPSSILTDLGYFDEKLKNGDDRDMWFRITRKYPSIYIDNELHLYRIRLGSISSGAATKRAQSKIKALEKQLENPLSQEYKQDIERLLSRNYHDIAVDAMNNNHQSLAFKNVIAALRHDFSKNNLGLLCKILMGSFFLKQARKLKSNINS